MMRREQAERTRELLLDAAAEEFWSRGLGGTRIQDVLDRAEVTKGGLYHHFTSKQELADALIAQEAERWPTVLTGVLGPGARGLVAVQELAATVAARWSEQVRARAVLRIADEVADPRAVAMLTQWQDAVVRALQQAIADGQLPDDVALRELAAALVESAYGALVAPPVLTAGLRDAEVGARVHRVSELLLIGAGARG